ncbi:MAG: tRNA preQ1(34) S-adenosylmethionine ribosyltransferase-isomerase QueA [Deltaproteobacteria bacterium]|nr:MAG: tRNA preQ1(34) S-adenosylmethionine ribosyltransferase-isomerase QueA [Deltaproteobacteria bacterium]
MDIELFDYQLPEELIAQEPSPRRDGARMMVVNRRTGALEHRFFRDFPELVGERDCLVLNDTRVIPARLMGTKETGGKVEVLLVRPVDAEDRLWLCMTRASKPPRTGQTILFAEGLSGVITADRGDGFRVVRFDCDADFRSVLERIGSLPLPPYIRRQPDRADRERYQTIVARREGAVAAPTAGLHFTRDVLEQVQRRGCRVCTLTLHVGLGTFLPVRTRDIRQHRMHAETYEVPEETARTVEETREKGGRVIAVGTTVTRVLEHVALKHGAVVPSRGESDLFIYPGFTFRAVDVLLTNFHLPKSTLLMLVSAFAGRETILRAYAQAVAERYRFFSYGDCMLLHS